MSQQNMHTLEVIRVLFKKCSVECAHKIWRNLEHPKIKIKSDRRKEQGQRYTHVYHPCRLLQSLLLIEFGSRSPSSFLKYTRIYLTSPPKKNRSQGHTSLTEYY